MIDQHTATHKALPMPSLKVAAAALASIAAAGIAALAGCEDAPRTTVSRAVEDPWALVQGGGLLPLVVRGRPAFASDEAVDDAVFRAAARAITWTATPPLMRAGPGDAAAGLRLVYVFNGAGGDACAANPTGGAPRPQGEVTLVAAFCDGGRPLVRVDGRVGRSAGLDDRRLLRLITQATRELLAPPPAPRP